MGKSVAVLGLGKYGKSLAENLYMMGADVLAVDKDKEVINEFAGKCTSAVCANLENEDEVEALGLKNMDIVVCATGNLAAAIMSVAVAKEKNVPLIVAKTSSDRMSSILLKIGVDKILDPEGEGGMRSARIQDRFPAACRGCLYARVCTCLGYSDTMLHTCRILPV